MGIGSRVVSGLGVVMYSDEECLESLRAFAREAGHQPSWQEWKAWRLRPSVTTIAARFGSWSNALLLAGLEARARGGEWCGLYEETALIAERVEAGERLAAIGRELGVSGQALGRRVARFRRMVGS